MSLQGSPARKSGEGRTQAKTRGTKGSWSRRSITIVFLLLAAASALLLFAPAAHAEGSKELTSQGGDRAFLWYRTSGGLSQFGGIPAQSALRVYAQPGERILLGSSAAGIGNGTINYTRPSGTTGTCGATGRISTRAQEVAGPAPASGGYTPCSITVGAAEGGVWQLRFISPASATGGIPTGMSATTAWTQSNSVSWIAAWDVTVRNAANTATIPGRVYANYISLSMGTGPGAGSTGRSFTPEVFVQTRDGYRFRHDYNGLDPLTFLTFANNKGFRDASGLPLFRSVQLTTGDAFQNGESIKDPGSTDTTTDVTHKLFFNTPNSSLPATATTAGGSTWLLNTPAPAPNVSNMTFTGTEGTQNQAAYGLGGTFSFDTDPNTTYRLIMDINGDATFGNGTDRILTGHTPSGQPQVYWDGKDSIGNNVATGATIATEVSVYSGEVHFPLLDPENNPGGTVIQRLIPSSNYTVYYDDRNLSGGTPPSPTQMLAGENSQTGSHEWSGQYGDHKGIDTWVYGASRTLSLSTPISIKTADLAVTNTDNQTNTASGSPITYTATITNNGPSNITGAPFTDAIPTGVSGVSWTCQITAGTGSCGTGSGTGNSIATTLSLNVNAVATFTVTGTVAENAPATLSSTVTVTRPADVADPNTSNDSATDTTTVNRRPVAEDKVYSATEDQPLVINAPGLLLNASDPDAGQTLVSQVLTGPSNGNVSVNSNGSFTYTPNANFNGTDTFTFRVCDNGTPVSCSVAKTVTITVNPVNDPPDAVNDSKSTNEDQTLTFPSTDLTANDSAGPNNENGQTLTVTGVSGATNGTVTLAGGTVTFTPAANYNGPASFTYTLSDGNGGTDTATVNITIDPLNDGPVAVDDSATTDEDEPLVLPAADLTTNDSAGPTNESGQTLTVTSVSSPTHGTVTLVAGTVTFTPAANYNGPASFTYTLSDGNGGTDTATVNITIDPVNDGPVAVNDAYDADEDQTLTADGQGVNPPDVLSNDTDVDGDQLTVTDAVSVEPGIQPVDGPNNGTLTLESDGGFVYLPDSGFTGTDIFVYEVCDEGNKCDRATVTIEVFEANAPIEVNDDNGSTGEAAAVSNAYISQYAGSAASTPTRLYGINAAQRPYTFVKRGKDVARPLNALGYRSTNHSLYGYRLRQNLGIVKVNPKTGVASFLGNPRGLPASKQYFAGDVSPNGSTYYLYANKTRRLWKVNLKAFTASSVKLSTSLVVSDLAVSPSDGRLYGVARDGKLLQVDPRSGKVNTTSVNDLKPGLYGATWFTSSGDLIAYENGNSRNNGTLTWIARPTKTPEVVSAQPGPATKGNDGAAYVAPPGHGGLAVRVDVLANDSDPDGSLNRSSLQIVEQPDHGAVVINADKTVTYTSNNTYRTQDTFRYQICNAAATPQCGTAAVRITAAPVTP